VTRYFYLARAPRYVAGSSKDRKATRSEERAPSEVHLGPVDFDSIVKGNTATQLPDEATTTSAGERPGSRPRPSMTSAFTTRIVERAFDQEFHPVPMANPARKRADHRIGGFDDIVPRRTLGNAGFAHVVDGRTRNRSCGVPRRGTPHFPCGQRPRTHSLTILGRLARSETPMRRKSRRQVKLEKRPNRGPAAACSTSPGHRRRSLRRRLRQHVGCRRHPPSPARRRELLGDRGRPPKSRRNRAHSPTARQEDFVAAAHTRAR